MLLRQGTPISFFFKKMLDFKSSREGELVSIDDALPLILWVRCFIKEQEYLFEQNIPFQNNKSMILMATNGRWSSSKWT